MTSSYIPANTQIKGNPKMSIVYCGAPTHLHMQHLTPRQPLRSIHIQHCCTYHKEIQAGYLSSPYFNDLYLFLSQNKLLSKRSSMKKVEMLAESFVLLDSLIFKLVMMPDKEAAVLAIPEICINKIITLYHTSLFAGHQGVVKTYLLMKDKFFIPNLMHYLRSFIKGCHIC